MPQPTCAVIGASGDRSKYGNKSVRAHQMSGYQVFPINPKGGDCENLTVLASIRDVPVRPLNRVSMYVLPRVGLSLLDDIAAVGCDELWLNPGTESDELIARAKSLGLNPICGCSIVDLGISPAALPSQ